MSLFFNAVLLFVAFTVSGQDFFRIWGTYPTHVCHSIREECCVYTWENFKLDELKIFYPCGLFCLLVCSVNTDFIGVLDPWPTKVILAVLFF